MTKTRVAVTGAAGQIGSVLLQRMVKSPDIDVVAVCRNPISAGIIESICPDIDIRMGSITEKESAKKLLGDVDCIVNCAVAMISGNPRMSHLLNKAMIDGFCNIKKNRTLIHLSSISVYGTCIDNTKSTFEKPRPDSDYGRSKLLVEKHLKKAFSDRGSRCYILRIGHIYGAKMDRSRQIIELAKDRNFRLPFNGDLPSNAIHVRTLAERIIALTSGEIDSGTYNIADKGKTWREVFNWHTEATGLPPVKEMSKEGSLRLKSKLASISLFKDIIGWVLSLPILSLVKYPAVFDMGYRALRVMPSTMSEHLVSKLKRFEVKRQIAALDERGGATISSVYFSDAMPGKFLAFPEDNAFSLKEAPDLSNDLMEWHERYSRPARLPESLER